MVADDGTGTLELLMVRTLLSFQALGIDGFLPAVTDNCSGGVDGRLYCVNAAAQGDTGRLYRPVSIQLIAHPVICIAKKKKRKKKRVLTVLTT